MLCPLMSRQIEGGSLTDCKKGNCAWWNNTECCIKTISIELIRIGEILQDTALPKATQINVKKK